MTASLSDICSLAIVEKDTEMLQYLVDICDALHDGKDEIDGFQSKDLPTDEKYEEMKKTIRENVRVSLLGIHSESVSELNRKYLRKSGLESNNVNTLGIKRTKLEDPDSLLVVDGIQTEESISEIEHAILMKKYDGCSICCVFSRCGLEFHLEYARTRGSEKRNGRDISDVTSKMKLIVSSLNPSENPSIHPESFQSMNSERSKTNECFEDSLNRFFRNTKIMRFLGKDFSKIGNTNPPKEFELKTIDIQKIVVRGELVLKEKLIDRPNCNAVAGPLNGKFQTFREKCDSFVWKPFEIINFTLNDCSKVIPRQKDALRFLIDLNQFNPDDFLELEHLDKDFDFLGLLKTWQSLTAIPLDGIVYCSEDFTYPSRNDESSKRVRYGKYKFKKNDVMTTKITGFEIDIGSTGKFTCVAEVEPLFANGKKYSHVKLPFRKIEDAISGLNEAKLKNPLKGLNEMKLKKSETVSKRKTKGLEQSETEKKSKNETVPALERTSNEQTEVSSEREMKRFGIGSVVEVVLSKDISLCLSRVLYDISKDVVPFEIPKICKYCQKELNLNRTKTDTVVSCTNPKCKGILMKRLEIYLSGIGMKGIAETTIFKYFENKEFSFRDFYRDVINVPLKSNTRRTGSTTVEKTGMKFNYNEILEKITNEKLLIALQLATQSNLKSKMEQYGLRFGKLDIAAIKRINDELVKEIF